MHTRKTESFSNGDAYAGKRSWAASNAKGHAQAKYACVRGVQQPTCIATGRIATGRPVSTDNPKSLPPQQDDLCVRRDLPRAGTAPKGTQQLRLKHFPNSYHSCRACLRFLSMHHISWCATARWACSACAASGMRQLHCCATCIN